MDDTVDTLLIDVRASTADFQQDIQAMRSAFDSTLVDGFTTAGNVLERGLTSAIRKGSLGFDDLRSVALRTINEIAAQALQLGFDGLFSGLSGSNNSGLAGILNGAIGAAFGLPGRAIGGSVSPGSPYLVGERGPELFVPTSAGRVETMPDAHGGGARNVNVAIQVATPRGTDSPVALKRSARQVASSVRRALAHV